MCFKIHMVTNDDELSFTSLAALTANVVTYLELGEQKKKDGERDAARDRTDEQNAEDQRAYIEQRLRELAAWERKISGRK